MPWWALAILVAGAVGVTARAYARPVVPMSPRIRLVLAGCRLCLFFLIILILQRPVLLEPSDDRRDAIVPILVDVSQSMRLNDVGTSVGNRPRIGEAAGRCWAFVNRWRRSIPATSGPMAAGAISAGRCAGSGNVIVGDRSPASSSCRMGGSRAAIHRRSPRMEIHRSSPWASGVRRSHAIARCSTSRSGRRPSPTPPLTSARRSPAMGSMPSRSRCGCSKTGASSNSSR